MTLLASARVLPVFLVVEDDPIVARALARVLAQFGRVEQVETVVEARLALTRGGAYAGILVDVMLGDANGFEVVDIALRQQPNTPVLVVTGTSAHEHADEAFRRRVRVLQKPFDISEITRWAEAATEDDAGL